MGPSINFKAREENNLLISETSFITVLINLHHPYSSQLGGLLVPVTSETQPGLGNLSVTGLLALPPREAQLGLGASLVAGILVLSVSEA